MPYLALVKAGRTCGISRWLNTADGQLLYQALWNIDKYVGTRVGVEQLNESCLIQRGKHVNSCSITTFLQMA